MKSSIFLTVLGIGLGAANGDFAYLLRKPGLLVRSLASMFLLMPLLAVLISIVFRLRPPVEIALMALAIAPVPPLLPKRLTRSGGVGSYTLGLLVAAALFAIAFAPLAVEFIGRIFARDVTVPGAVVAKIAAMTVLLPLGAGILMRRFKPALAERAAQPVQLLGGVMLALGALPILPTAWHAIMTLIGNGTVAAITAFILAGLAAGHLSGGPGPEERTILALSTACRHPAIAIAIAHSVAPGQTLVPAVVLLYLLVSFLLTVPYLSWRRRGTLQVPVTPRPFPRR